MLCAGVNSLISLVQSRGRARCEHSRIVVLLSDQMWAQQEQLDRRERLMELVLRQSVVSDRVPSSKTKERIRLLKNHIPEATDSGAAALRALEADGSGISGELVVRLICFGVGCTSLRLKEALCESLQESALGLRVSMASQILIFWFPTIMPQSLLCELLAHAYMNGFSTFA